MYKLMQSIFLKCQYSNQGRQFASCLRTFNTYQFNGPEYVKPFTELFKIKGSMSSHFHTSSVSQFHRIYEPDYLELLRPKEPVHELLNVQMHGYDFVVLERFQGLLHSLIDSLGLDVSNGWAQPPELWKIERFIPKSNKPDAEFRLKKYKRIIQITDVPPAKLSILLELLQECTPPGVTCSVVEHTEEMDKERYVPDLELRELKRQLEELGGPRPPSRK